MVKAIWPWDRVSVDFKEPVRGPRPYLLIIADEYSRFPFVFPCKNMYSSTVIVIDCLSSLFCLLGFPCSIHSDRGASFVSLETRNFQTASIRESRGGKGAIPPKLLENRVILCFERRFYKQNSVIRLKSSILLRPQIFFTPPQISGLATPLTARGITFNTNFITCKATANANVWIRLFGELSSLFCIGRNLHEGLWESVLPEALHAVRSLVCLSTNETPHQRFFRFPRRAMFGTALPLWFLSPGTVLLRRFVRNKSEPLCDIVDLVEANQHYAIVRHENGSESSVSTSDLAP